MRRTLIAIGLSLVAAVFGNRAFAEPAEAPVLKATPAMWVAHGPKGTVYLLGSIHALPKNVDWQTPEITAAIKRADTFVFEIPLNDDSREKLVTMYRQKGFLPFSLSLPSLFDAEMREDYRNVILTTHADPTVVVYLRPWLAAMVLQGQADGTGNLVPAEGVDNKIYAEAQARHVRNFRALETDEQQFKILMGNGNIEDELTALRLTFKHILAQHGDDVDGLVHAWARGDTKALAGYGPDSPSMSQAERKIFLEDRNEAWIPQIAGMLNTRHVYFITVGALHLVGKMGVPNLLRAAGYRVDGP